MACSNILELSDKVLTLLGSLTGHILFERYVNSGNSGGTRSNSYV